jgi:hypothetical protein
VEKLRAEESHDGDDDDRSGEVVAEFGVHFVSLWDLFYEL